MPSACQIEIKSQMLRVLVESQVQSQSRHGALFCIKSIKPNKIRACRRSYITFVQIRWPLLTAVDHLPVTNNQPASLSGYILRLSVRSRDLFQRQIEWEKGFDTFTQLHGRASSMEHRVLGQLPWTCLAALSANPLPRQPIWLTIFIASYWWTTNYSSSSIVST